MYRAAFRLTDNTDPEERLDEAALWKAMYDQYGKAIVAVRGHADAPRGLPVFGRTPRFPVQCANPVPPRLDYWTDPAFLGACRREFHVVPFEDAEPIVRGLQARGQGAFVKSTNLKHFTTTVGADEDFREKIGVMAFSFIDGGPELMVQELALIEYEYRYFVIDRQVVTSSPNMTWLTPIDYPLPNGTVFRTPQTTIPESRLDIVSALESLANDLASSMATPHACIDVALINGVPGRRRDESDADRPGGPLRQLGTRPRPRVREPYRILCPRDVARLHGCRGGRRGRVHGLRSLTGVRSSRPHAHRRPRRVSCSDTLR